MHLVDHRLRARKTGIEELHRVPVIVVAPILPVLDDSVYRHSVLPIATQDLEELSAVGVALAALPEAVAPERVHRDLPREVTHCTDDSVERPARDEVVVLRVAYVALESNCFVIGLVPRYRHVVPVEPPSADAAEERNAVIAVFRLKPQTPGVALVEASVLHAAESVHRRVLRDLPLLRDLRRRVAALVCRLREFRGTSFFEHDRAVGTKERKPARLLVEPHGKRSALPGLGVVVLQHGHLHLLRLRRDDVGLFDDLAVWSAHDSRDRWRIERHFDIRRVCGKGKGDRAKQERATQQRIYVSHFASPLI